MDPKWVSQKEDGQRTCHQGIPTHLVIGKAVPSSVAGFQELRRVGRNFGIKTSKAMY